LARVHRWAGEQNSILRHSIDFDTTGASTAVFRLPLAEIVFKMEQVIRKLSSVEDLSFTDITALERLGKHVVEYKRGDQVISQGKRSDQVHVITEGWAARYSVLSDGCRKITAFLLPGDFCDLHLGSFTSSDQSVIALTDCSVAVADRRTLVRITRESPALARAFWHSTLIDEAILRRWLINAGRRLAKFAIAHLLCELHSRRLFMHKNFEQSLSLPLTQSEIGDATGFTQVHVNRSLQALRAEGLLSSGPSIHISDLDGLQKLAMFTNAYLT